MKILVYIASDVRSGSTMLANLIGNHPDVATVGELRQLTAHINLDPSAAAWDGRCTCRKTLDECPVWGPVLEAYEDIHGTPRNEIESGCRCDFRKWFCHFTVILAFLCPFRSVKKRLILFSYKTGGMRSLGDTCYNILEIFTARNRKSAIVDSSKTVQQFLAMVLAKPEDYRIRLIHLVRDGRAVVSSKLKWVGEYEKYRFKCGLFQATKGWVYTNLLIRACGCFLDRNDIIEVRYEDLCKNKEKAIRRICERFSIPFDPLMLQLSNKDKHDIGGSAHRFNWDSDTPLVFDDSWKKRLSRWQKVRYYLFAGLFHKMLGY